MVAVPHPIPEAGSRPHQRRPRIAWLVLAADGPAAELAGQRPDTVVRVVGDPRRFRGLLLAERPVLVVLVQPPAGPEDLALVAAERRRRPRLRAVHLAPPEASAMRLAALVLGFDDALTTDTSPSELAGRLVLLEERARVRAESGSLLPVGDDLALDLAARELRRPEGPIHLRPKEFGLLALLASHPGRVFTRRELLDHVWGTGHPSGSRTVDVHVRWLRLKIEPDPDAPVRLVTARGTGYRFEPAAALTGP
jgi:DNA-binding response OmpR family regulator